MLVLRRKPGEKIFISVPIPGDEDRIIELEVVSVEGQYARLGLTAEKDINIWREGAVRKT